MHRSMASMLFVPAIFLLTFGAVSVPAQVLGPQSAGAARFGQRRIGPQHQALRGAAGASPAAQADTTVGFALIERVIV
jgi:hypothetical protein